MDQLHLMRVYVAVADCQGFAAGARLLNMSPPAITRAVAALEQSLGVKLLIRTTRNVRTTEAGARYLEDARRILEQVDRANEAAIGLSSEPKGRLSVTAPVLFGQQYVMPGIVAFLSEYPQTQVHAVFLDRVVNLLEEGFDLGVRIGHLPDSNMHAKQVGAVRSLLVAAPSYLAQQGKPNAPGELDQHQLIHVNAGSMSHDWQFNDKQNKKMFVRVSSRLNVTTHQGAINAAKQGFGITRVLSYQVANELAAGELVTLMTTFEPPAMPVHIIHREGRMASAKVRCFIELMSEHLRSQLGRS